MLSTISRFITPFTVLGGALAAAVACASPAPTAGTAVEVQRTDVRVPSDAGIEIAVRELRVADDAAAEPERGPVLLLHGARVPGPASFDLPVPGGSVAADLARAGHEVYVMDARGYGGSTRTAALDQPAEANPPAVPSDAVVRDVAAVVDHVTRMNGVDQVALLGWATGGHWLGQYAAANPERVDRLVLYNTLYGPIDGHPTLGRGSDYEDPRQPGQFDSAGVGAYRLSTGASLLPSWDSSIPVADKSTWRDPAIVDAYVREALASDPTSGTREPASFRAPTGALKDSFALATGQQLWSAERITAPTLVLRSEYDFWSRPQDAQLLEQHLTRAGTEVRSVNLAGATHYAHLDRPEHGGQQFRDEVLGFLATG